MLSSEANTNKLSVYKKVLQEVCEKFDGAKEFIKEKIEEICSNGRLSVEEVTQPANIGPQDDPRTPPSNVPRTSPKDPI